MSKSLQSVQYCILHSLTRLQHLQSRIVYKVLVSRLACKTSLNCSTKFPVNLEKKPVKQLNSATTGMTDRGSNRECTHSGHIILATLNKQCESAKTCKYLQHPTTPFLLAIIYLAATTALQSFNGLFSRTTWVNWYQRGKTKIRKTSLDLNEARNDGISIRKQSARRSRQITTPTSHHSILQAGCSS